MDLELLWHLSVLFFISYLNKSRKEEKYFERKKAYGNET